MGNNVDQMVDLAKESFPHGHPAFNHVTIQEMELHSRKNHDYARGGSPLGNFERVARILSNYPNLKLSDQKVVALVYAMKQMDAALNMLSVGYDGDVEGIYQRLSDVSVYTKLVQCMLIDEDGNGNR